MVVAFSTEREKAAREHGKIHDVEQTKKIAPFITRETLFSQHVCELILGVHICDSDFGVELDSVKQPI